MKTNKIRIHSLVLVTLTCLTFIQASNSFAAFETETHIKNELNILNSEIKISSSALQQQLDQMLKNPKTTVQQIKSFIVSPAFTGQASSDSLQIVREITKILKLNDIFDIFEKMPKASSAFIRYIDPQDDGEPIWQSTNRKLRTGEPMTADQAEFATELIEGLKALPSIEVLSFRGALLQKKYFDLYQEGQIYLDKAFSSTSLDPQIASGFSGTGTIDRWSTLFIIYGKSGRFISLFKPENIHEQEILFPASTPFKVMKKIIDEQTQSAVIVLQE